MQTRPCLLRWRCNSVNTVPSSFVAARQIQQGSSPAIVAMLSSSHLAYGCFVISSTTSSCFVTSPHPLATVTVFPRPKGHSYIVICPQRGNVFSPSTFERYSRTSGQALCHLPTAAALRFWSGGAVLSHARFRMLFIAIPSLSHLGAAYWPSSRLDCHTLMPA